MLENSRWLPQASTPEVLKRVVQLEERCELPSLRSSL